LVSYKPERRAVLRWGNLFVKAYLRPDDFARATESFAAAAGLRPIAPAALVGSVPQLQLTAQRAVAGVPVSERPGSVGDVGRLLASLHAAPIPRGLPRANASAHLDQARRTAAHVAFLLPVL